MNEKLFAMCTAGFPAECVAVVLYQKQEDFKRQDAD